MDAKESRSVAYDVIRDGGGTFSPVNGQPIIYKRGYYVGGSIPTLTSDNLSPRNIAALARSYAERIDKPNTFLGVWIDGGTIYFDASTIIANLDNALSVAKRRGEIAIWDIRANAAITVSEV